MFINGQNRRQFYGQVATLRVPEGRHLFIGLNNGARERGRLGLNDIDDMILGHFGTQLDSVYLEIREDTPFPLMTYSYMKGLLGRSVLTLGVDKFLKTYDIRQKKEPPMEEVVLADIFPGMESRFRVQMRHMAHRVANEHSQLGAAG